MFAVSDTLSRYHAQCRSGLFVTVRLGSSRQADCRGTGICKMALASVDQAAAVVTAYLRRDALTGRLLVHFRRLTVTEAVRRHHFRHGVLTLTDPYRLPQDIVEGLRLPPGDYYLGAGDYPTLDDDFFHTVSLRITTTAYCQNRLLSAA
ncbi:hypothetical protein [Lewinella sp. JB7]|uniref:hypothetical protein n=1 Tax=Lewinella sp. JB7 TaxID=2962887 RepID=UPI0020C9E581|nr:hypothetical protein [Lewinella sp. JB7]MCP9235690.1 hypothetical protein [Lewinella sp. JB7]